MEAADGVLEDASEAADAAEVTEDSTDGVEEQPVDPELIKVKHEAKNLRARLREAEAERDSLRESETAMRESVTAMHRAEAVRVAAGTLSDGEDLFRGGVDLADLLGEDGRLDSAKITEAAKRVAAEHPNWTPSRVVPQLRPGQGSTPDSASQWQEILRSS